MVNGDNVHIVQNDLDLLNQIMGEFQRSCNAWSGLLENEVVEAYEWYYEHSKSIIDFRIEVRQWISQAKQCIEDKLDKGPNSSISSQRSSRRSSRRSKASSSGSVRSALARERAKSAELKTKALMLNKRQALENEVEKLRIEEELAVAQARERVYAEAEEAEINGECLVELQLPKDSSILPNQLRLIKVKEGLSVPEAHEKNVVTKVEGREVDKVKEYSANCLLFFYSAKLLP